MKKGARHHYSRPTWIEVDLTAIRFNVRQLRCRLPASTKILAAVKSNAYGHGIVEVAQALARDGVEYLGVSSVDEGVHLRDVGIRAPILVLTALLPHELATALKARLTLTVPSLELAQQVSRAARRARTRAMTHIKVDTGMGRLGMWHEEAAQAIRRIWRLPGLAIEGIYTHLAAADEDAVFTRLQIRDFLNLLVALQADGIRFALRHIANSMGLVGFGESHLNLVRPGLMIYGLYPREDLRDDIRLKPALTLKSQIIFLKHVPAGHSISYGRTFITSRPTTIATIPIGYGDGYSRAFSNNAEALVRGRRVPVVGRVCMDLTMLDVGQMSGVAIGDEVVLIGRQQEEVITVEALAARVNTIPYEIVTSLSPRIRRIYQKGARHHFEKVPGTFLVHA